MSTPEITVLGAGIFGLSVAWSCLRKGARVTVVEKREIGAGASGGIVGALAPHTPENWNDKKQFQFESLLMAQSYWDEVEAISGQPSGYARSGRLQPINDEKTLQLAKTRADNAKTLWAGQANWTIEEADIHGVWFPKSTTGQVIHDTLSARIHPRMAVTCLAKALENSGCEFVTETPLRAGIVVDATGYEGLRTLSAELDQPVGNGVKGQALLLDYDARDAPQLFADALHIVPHSDGTVAIGSTSETTWQDPTTTDDQLDEVYARAMRAFPVLENAKVLSRWAGVRPRARSRAPMLGAHPLNPDMFIANGGFKIGFGMAPKVGDVMADLILTGHNAIPESFRVEASLR